MCECDGCLAQRLKVIAFAYFKVFKCDEFYIILCSNFPLYLVHMKAEV
jgi:hypothetical protein